MVWSFGSSRSWCKGIEGLEKKDYELKIEVFLSLELQLVNKYISVGWT